MANIAVGHYRNVSHQPVRTDRKRPNVKTDTCFPQPPSFGHDNLSDRADAAYSVRERKRNFRLPVLATTHQEPHPTGRGKILVACVAKSGRGNVPVARTPNPKPHKPPKIKPFANQHDNVTKVSSFTESFSS